MDATACIPTQQARCSLRIFGGKQSGEIEHRDVAIRIKDQVGNVPHSTEAQISATQKYLGPQVN